MPQISKLPPGCAVEWTKEPAKQTRLLDWLDKHPVERACLFSNPGVQTTPSKSSCAIKAARYVFRDDENPNNSAAVVGNPIPFARTITRLISSGPYCWKLKYRAIIEEIGPRASRLRYEDIKAGNYISKDAADKMKRFPQWEQLHRFWRTSLDFNPFAVPQPRSTDYVSSLSTKRKAESQPLDSAIDPFDSCFKQEELDHDVKPSIRPLKKRRGAGSIQTPIVPPQPSFDVPQEKPIISATNSTANKSMGDTPHSSPQLTGDQLFELEMAKIMYETRKEENIARQQEQTQQVLLALLDATGKY